MKVMSKRKALHILITAAGRRVGGAGQGLSQPLTEQEASEVTHAVRVLWKQAYGYEPCDNDLRNMGFRGYK